MASAKVARSENTGESVKRRPQIVLVEHNPWLMVIGSDSPTFVLYEDRLVIFRRKSGERMEYVSVLLEREDKEQLLRELPLAEFEKLEENYDLSDWQDMPANVIYVGSQGRLKKVTAYGNLREAEPDPETRSRAPEPFLKLFDRLIGYENEKATPWLPDRIEVMIWPYEYSPTEPMPWPPGWPDLQHPETKQRGEAYSLFLKAEQSEDLRQFLKGMAQKQAVLINGKKWAISYRLPFPGEDLWLESSASPG